MLIAVAGDSRIDAGLAKIEIAALANSTVIMFVRNSVAAVVTVDAVRGRWEVVD